MNAANHPRKQVFYGGVEVGPFSGRPLAPEERKPHTITEEAVTLYAKQHSLELLEAERRIREANIAYNVLLAALKGALEVFQKTTGLKPTRAKDEVWLPKGRKISHREFIDNLDRLVEEYRHG